MEFFDWMGVPQTVFNYLAFQVDSAAEAAELRNLMMTICLSAAAGLYLLGLLCGGFGLMTMAKKQGIKYWWFGFLPFGNTYLTGKLAGETRMFSAKCKRIGLYAMLLEIGYVALEIGVLVLLFTFNNPEFYVHKLGSDGEVASAIWSWDFETMLPALYPELSWLVKLYRTLSYIAQIWWFVMLFFMCFLFSAFFRKYYAKSPFLMTFLCALLPLRGFVLLAVRNNPPVDYTAYMRRRYEQMQQPPYGGYGNYGGQNYGGNGTSGSSGTNDPFGEFGGSNGSNGSAGGGNGTGGSNDSPFSDFN